MGKENFYSILIPYLVSYASNIHTYLYIYDCGASIEVGRLCHKDYIYIYIYTVHIYCIYIHIYCVYILYIYCIYTYIMHTQALMSRGRIYWWLSDDLSGVNVCEAVGLRTAHARISGVTELDGASFASLSTSLKPCASPILTYVTAKDVFRWLTQNFLRWTWFTSNRQKGGEKLSTWITSNRRKRVKSSTLKRMLYSFFF